jgi:hypothetical protein
MNCTEAEDGDAILQSLTVSFCQKHAADCRALAKECNEPLYEERLKAIADEWDGLAEILKRDQHKPPIKAR